MKADVWDKQKEIPNIEKILLKVEHCLRKLRLCEWYDDPKVWNKHVAGLGSVLGELQDSCNNLFIR